MNDLSQHPQRPAQDPILGQAWLDQIFRGKALVNGGIIKRNVFDVQREIGQDALELAVRRRGFRMIKTQTHYLIVCNQGPIDIIC